MVKAAGAVLRKKEPLPFLYRHTPGGKFRGQFRGCLSYPRNCSP